jgi:hypothetical protein
LLGWTTGTGVGAAVAVGSGVGVGPRVEVGSGVSVGVGTGDEVEIGEAANEGLAGTLGGAGVIEGESKAETLMLEPPHPTTSNRIDRPKPATLKLERLVGTLFRASVGELIIISWLGYFTFWVETAVAQVLMSLSSGELP